ncbi:MAG: hypothetical protein JWQ10_1347 [Herbaspirillum sp.]|nr:hypothetical protein [Herbaspirillum sp.]
MAKEKFNVPLAVKLIFSILAITVFSFAFCAMTNKITVAELPSWLQALWGLIAILAILGMGIYQVDSAKEQAEATDQILVRRRYAALRAILDDAHDQCESLRPEFHDHDEAFGIFSFVLNFDERAFNGVLETIERVPLHELDNYQIVKSLSGIRNLLINITSIISFASDQARSKIGEEGGTPDYAIKDRGRILIDEVNSLYKAAITEISST